jgi:hypothetical protein
MTHIDEFTLQEYADNALDEQQRRDAAAHLATCPSCRQQLADMQHLLTAFATMQDEPLTTDLSARVLTALQPDLFWRRWSNLILTAQVLLFVVMAAVLWPLISTTWQSASQIIEMTTWELPQLFAWADLLSQAVTLFDQVKQWQPSLNLTDNQWIGLLLVTLILWVAGNKLIFTTRATVTES